MEEGSNGMISGRMRMLLHYFGLYVGIVLCFLFRLLAFLIAYCFELPPVRRSAPAGIGTVGTRYGVKAGAP